MKNSFFLIEFKFNWVFSFKTFFMTKLKAGFVKHLNSFWIQFISRGWRPGDHVRVWAGPAFGKPFKPSQYLFICIKICAGFDNLAPLHVKDWYTCTDKERNTLNWIGSSFGMVDIVVPLKHLTAEAFVLLKHLAWSSKWPAQDKHLI